jgi:hypothetical protein
MCDYLGSMKASRRTAAALWNTHSCLARDTEAIECIFDMRLGLGTEHVIREFIVALINEFVEFQTV